MRITEPHLEHACKKCVAKYRELLRLPAFYDRIYNVLVELAGADSKSRADFIRYFVEGHDAPNPLEWRFQGKFGSGGKLYKLAQGHEVMCYPEDLNSERGELLKTVNERLAAVIQE